MIANWFDPEKLAEMFAVEYVSVTRKMTLPERFNAIRKNYATYQSEVDKGNACWMKGNPYEIADWLPIFTPIEYAAWQDIRCAGLPLWPQLPVGRFFVDFGNPEVRVALECDGKEFHNAEKDAARDKEMAKMGWVVIRAPGWRCAKVMDSPTEIRAYGNEVPDGYEELWMDNTMAGVIDRLRSYF